MSRKLVWLALIGQLSAAPDAADDAAAAIDGAVQGWSPRALVTIAGPDDETGMRRSPALSPDGLELYFVHRATLLTWRANRATTADTWGAPQVVTAIAAGTFQITPRLSGDGRRLYFASNGPSQGAADIYVSTRSTLGDPWGEPVLVPELNSGDQDLTATPCLGATRFVFESNWVSADERQAMFVLNGLGGSPDRTLYESFSRRSRAAVA